MGKGVRLGTTREMLGKAMLGYGCLCFSPPSGDTRETLNVIIFDKKFNYIK